MKKKELDESTTVISDLKITLENSEKDLQNAGFGGDVESLQKETKNLLEDYGKKIKLTEDYKKQHEQLLEKVDIMEKKGEEEKKKQRRVVLFLIYGKLKKKECVVF